MKKFISLILSATILLSTLTGCSAPTETAPEVAEIPINVAVLKGPTGMGMVKLMEDNDNKTSLNPYNFTISGTADEIVAGIAKGEIDIAAVPGNLASVLYNKTEGQVSMAAINTLGVLYVVESGNTIKSIEDLKGKKIYSTGKGTTPEYSLNYILSSNNIDPINDVEIEFKSEATELASILETEENAIAILPEPFVTSTLKKNPSARIALSLGEEWTQINGQSMVTGALIVRNEFLKENPGVFNTFLQEYEGSIKFLNGDIQKSAELVDEYGIVPKAVALEAIPRCNIVFISGKAMEDLQRDYLTILFEMDPKSIGGKLPNEDFYYKG